MADALLQLAGWVAVIAIWSFLPVAGWHTWRDYNEQRKARSRVIRIERLAVGRLA